MDHVVDGAAEVPVIEYEKNSAATVRTFLKLHPVCMECRSAPAVDIVYKVNPDVKGYDRFHSIMTVCGHCKQINIAKHGYQPMPFINGAEEK